MPSQLYLRSLHPTSPTSSSTAPPSFSSIPFWLLSGSCYLCLQSRQESNISEHFWRLLEPMRTNQQLSLSLRTILLEPASELSRALSKLRLAVLAELPVAPFSVNKMPPNIFQGMTDKTFSYGSNTRLITTLCLEAFACFLAGIMALWFHRKNRQADSSEDALKGKVGFRYTI